MSILEVNFTSEDPEVVSLAREDMRKILERVSAYARHLDLYNLITWQEITSDQESIFKISGPESLLKMLDLKLYENRD